jgi:membrane protease subunit HflC
MRISQIIPIFLVVFTLLAVSSLFTVDEREYAIKLRLGKIEQADYKPGLHIKRPFFDEIKKFDKRLRTVDLPAEEFPTKEQKYMVVDSFVKWRINDVLTFFKSVGGRSNQAERRLATIINDSLRSAIANHTIQEAISEKRNSIMEAVQKAVNAEAAILGIEVTDVRIKRLDFPQRIRVDVFKRMAKGREKVAREIRSTGQEEAKKIRASADRQKQEILAEAYRTAETDRGEGDAKAAEIYAKAYGKDPEFYRFYRSLNAYKSSFNDKEDVFVVQPDSEFFRYMNSSTGK